jgi:tetratricopeptide (TPR) repeat protein
MRWLLPLAASVLGFAQLATAFADDQRDCRDGKDYASRIKSCSMLVQRDPYDAVAYHDRGTAYGLAGEVDNAIADYDKAIQLKPDFAPAYNSRGLAYVSKGDYTRGLTDVTTATQLARKAAPKDGKAAAKPVAATKPAAKQAATKPTVTKQAVTKETPKGNTYEWPQY